MHFAGKIFNNHKASSLAQWAILFALIPATLFFMQVSLKNTLHIQGERLADVVFWERWGQTPVIPELYPENVKQRGQQNTHQYSYYKEREGRVGSISDLNNTNNPNIPENQYTHTRSEGESLTIQSPEGAEELFNNTTY